MFNIIFVCIPKSIIWLLFPALYQYVLIMFNEVFDLFIPEPPSQKSSRAPSPVSGQKYDALEGQFSPQGN